VRTIIRQAPFIILTICTLSCSTTKYVGDNEYLLDKVKISADNDRIKVSDLKPYLRQQPNYKIFGLLKWPLYVYNWSGKNEKNWLNKQLRRIGEPPEIMDTLLVAQSNTEFERMMINKGYLHAATSYSIDTTRRKKATVNYHIVANAPYHIQQYRMTLDDPRIDSLAHLKAPPVSWLKSFFSSAPEEYTPLIQEGSLFDRDILDKERKRITAILRRKGYYAFNYDHIGFTADSLPGRNAVNLEMTLKPFRYVDTTGIVREKTHRLYYINRVHIVTDYDPLNVNSGNEWQTFSDSVWKQGIHIYYGIKGRTIRPNVLLRKCYVVPGELFNERHIEQTYAAFSTLGMLRHVNIRYDEFEENDTMKLNCTVLTTPEKTQGFGVDVEGTNSAGDLGFATSLNYQHRNLFKGSELFSARIRGAYESLSASKETGFGNYWEFAGELSLRFPTFKFPFVSNDFIKRLRATTEFDVSYNRQSRPEYQRAILSGGWSYSWQNRTNLLEKHTLKLLDINYIYLPYIDEDFKNSLPRLTTLYNYNNQFIVGSGYTYLFNNYDPMKRGRNTYSFRVNIESAGNGLYTLSSLLNTKKDANGHYQLFGINYSQYLKGDMDFARSVTIDGRNSLAFHIGGGLACPYGNARELPFERRYYAGGANSNRGWSVRSLGPGSMPITDETTFVNQVGDVRLDASLEYRSKLFWKFEMAAFIDGGNIWTIHSYDYQPQGKFNFTRFYKEIAVSYGLGLRLDFDYFLIRFDTGLKAYNPQEQDARRWSVLHPNLHDNFAWHFAVGYPF